MCQEKDIKKKMALLFEKVYILGFIFYVLWGPGQVLELGKRQREAWHLGA